MQKNKPQPWRESRFGSIHLLAINQCFWLRGRVNTLAKCLDQSISCLSLSPRLCNLYWALLTWWMSSWMSLPVWRWGRSGTGSSRPPSSSSRSQTCNRYSCDYHVHLLLLHLEWCFSSFAILNISSYLMPLPRLGCISRVLFHHKWKNSCCRNGKEMRLSKQIQLWEKVWKIRSQPCSFERRYCKRGERITPQERKKEAINHWDLSFTPERKENSPNKERI